METFYYANARIVLMDGVHDTFQLVTQSKQTFVLQFEKAETAQRWIKLFKENVNTFVPGNSQNQSQSQSAV